MFKNLYFILLILVCTMFETTNANQLPTILAINSKSEINEEIGLPRNFRMSSDNFKKSDETLLPSVQGLKNLNILGSAQFSEQNLAFLLKHIDHPKNLFIVDLRQEWHGFLNTGIPVNWYGVRNASNAGKTITQIMHEEKEQLNCLLERKNIVLSKIVHKDKLGKELPEVSSVPFRVNKIFTEEELAAKYHLGYIRIPVGDALSPNKEMVDRFIDFVKTLPKDSWIYFHCAAGRGRTTSFMVMYDILKNANSVSFDDIIKRQYLLGGADLSKFGSDSSWKYAYAVQRYQFLKDFYTYVKSTVNTNQQMSWSEYLSKNNLISKSGSENLK